MELNINHLPSKTWNRLGMNKSSVQAEELIHNRLPAAGEVPAGMLWQPEADPAVYREDLQTGMGADIRKLTENAAVSLVSTTPGAKPEHPLVLTYAYEEDEMAASRLVLHAQKDSLLSVVLLFTSPTAESKGLSAIQTEIFADENAEVQVAVAQLLGDRCTGFHDFGGVCAESASVRLTRLELGSGRMYTGSLVDLLGRDSAFNMDIGYQVRSERLLDMNYEALHHGQNTQSYMEVCGTLEEKAKKVFRGSIDFKRGCAGSKGTESENVLLFGDSCVNQTVPLILCTEEDVDGSHGASIGRLDDRMLFYLSTRGIPEKAAQQIIAQSRIESVCERIPDEGVREAVCKFEEQRGLCHVAEV